MSRALRFNPLAKMPVYYSDITLNIDTNPMTGELVKVTNNDAITNSIRNLILTNNGERFYQPLVGSKIQSALFEMDDQIMSDIIKSTITETIQYQEPRAVLKDVIVVSDPINNGVRIKILFTSQNIPEVVSTELFVRRDR